MPFVMSATNCVRVFILRQAAADAAHPYNEIDMNNLGMTSFNLRDLTSFVQTNYIRRKLLLDFRRIFQFSRRRLESPDLSGTKSSGDSGPLPKRHDESIYTPRSIISSHPRKNSDST